MKLKSIIWIALATFMAFSACTQEEPIDQGGKVKDGIPTTLNITVSTGEVTSKTLPLDTKIVPDAEKNINSLAIVLFKDDANKTYLSHHFASFTEEDAEIDTETGHTGRKAYTIGGLSVETGNVIVLAIANSSKFTKAADLNDLVESAGFTYTKFKEETEDTYNDTYAFESSNLVKFAEEKIYVSTTAKSHHIALTQLAARITVNVKTTGYPDNEKWDYFINKVEIDGLQLGSNVFLSSGTTASNENTTAFGTKNDEWVANGTAFIQSFSFYTYERKTTEKDPEIRLYGTLYEKNLEVNEGVSEWTVVGSEAKNYTLYINPVPKNNVETGEICTTTGIVHGNAYEVTGVINIETMNITFSTKVIDWSLEPIYIGGDILDLHYLFVEEHNITMTNTGTYKINYKADLTVSEKSITNVYCWVTGLDGNKVKMEKKDYYLGDAEFPSIYVNPTTKQIEITSSIPINYAPKYFTFTVTNNMGLEETVEVTQYPPVYLTGRESNGDANKLQPDGANNPNLFTVTFTASNGYLLGDPRNKTTNPVTTKTDVASNELISPKFIIASRYAVTSSVGFSSAGAHERCKSYYEDEYDDGWRVPTIAELEFLCSVQRDSNSAISYLFGMVSGGKITKMSKYWSALPNWGYDFDNKERTNDLIVEGTNWLGNPNDYSYYGGIRCVKDLY